MKPLELLSYNIEFGKKFDDVITWITSAQLSPDVFCFQEFPETKIPFFKNFLSERGYHYAYTPAIALRGIQLGELTAHKTAALELRTSKGLMLGRYVWERGRRMIDGERSSLLTAYSYQNADFAIANVHLSNLSPHSMRFKQLAMVIGELKQLSENALIMGDFNYTSLFGVKRLIKFMQSYGYTCVGERMITHRLYNHIPQQLDYVFQKGFTPQGIEVLKVPHSDHLPLSMKLTMA